MPYKNPENAKRDAYFRQYRRLNKKKIAQKDKARYEKNRDSILEYAKPLMSEWRRLSRAKARGSYVPLTEDEKKALVVIEKTRRELAKDTGKVYEIDHIIPVSFGGLHHPINVRIVEIAENKLKSNSMVVTPEIVSLVKQHHQLYQDRVSPQKAQEFIDHLPQSFKAIDVLGCLPVVHKSTLEQFFD